jgi:hypothetical protein
MRTRQSLFFPRCGGCAALYSLWRGQAQKARIQAVQNAKQEESGTNKFYSRLMDFTSEIGLCIGVYRAYFQWFAGCFVGD